MLLCLTFRLSIWNVKKNRLSPRHISNAVNTRHVARTVLLVLVALLLAVGSAAYGLVHNLQSNISQVNVDDLLGDARPAAKGEDNPLDPNAGQPVNILVLGSDVRSGDSDIDNSGKSGKVTGMRADTTMLFHISADRRRIDVVSVPRDMLVPLPNCTVINKDGKQSQTKAQKETMFNAAFALGGQGGNVGSAAACAIRTFEQMSDLRIDGFVVVDFASFKAIVDTLGGVPMYFPEAVKDQASGLNVPAGCRLLMGDQALALARARKQVGDGSDISRIGRQQELVTAMLNEVLSMNLFTNMPKLYSVFNTVSSSITTSEGLGNLSTLSGLAYSLRGLDMSKVTFVTMPWMPDAASGGNRVRPAKNVQVLWDAIEADHPITVTKQGNQSIVTDTVTGASTDGKTRATTTPQAPSTAPSSSSSAATPSNAATNSTGTGTTGSATTPNSSSTPRNTSPQEKSKPICTKENAVA